MDEATLRRIGQVARQAGLKTCLPSATTSASVCSPSPSARAASGATRTTLCAGLQVIDVAKRAGFSLDEARVLLATGHGGPPAHAQLRELAERKLPEVDELIARAQAVRAWLVTASGCDCDTLDVCALFDPDAPSPPEVRVSVAARS